MNYIVTAAQMKSAEENAVNRGISLRVLAENAAVACCNYITKKLGDIHGKTFTVLCGKGMNGGDGMLISRFLRSAGAEVLCVLVELPKNELALEIHSELAPMVVSTVYEEHKDAVKYTLKNTHVIIDCVYGFGFTGELDGKIADLFAFINEECKALKISVDLPSGVDATTGLCAEHAFNPDITLILGAYKKGLLSHPAFDLAGESVVLDIGLSPNDFTEYEAIRTDKSIVKYRPQRAASSHKGSHGRVFNIAGSERYIGAALLSTKAAVKTGAGLVTLCAPERVITTIASAIPEAVFAHCDLKSISNELKSADAVCVGCGLGNSQETRKITEFVVKNASCPIILDADGINSISDNINVIDGNKPMILTPHPGEFSRLTGLSVAEIQSNRIDTARLFAKESGAVVVLKGVNTVIASPNGEICVNSTGNAGLAKAGSGDVLSGIIAALAAGGVTAFRAAVLGVYLHGLAADRLAETMPLSRITASDVIENI